MDVRHVGDLRLPADVGDGDRVARARLLAVAEEADAAAVLQLGDDVLEALRLPRKSAMTSKRLPTSTRSWPPSARDSTTPGSHPETREKSETYANTSAAVPGTSIVRR